MKIRLRSPRQLARTLLDLARRRPSDVADYLEQNPEEWEALAEALPGDAADVLEQLDEEDVVGLLRGLEASDAAEVLEEMSPELAVELIEELPVAQLAAALSEMPGDAAADLIGELDEDVQEDILAAMSDTAEEQVRTLLAYPRDTAGGLMTTEIAKLPWGLTTGEAIERIRQLHDEWEDLSYVYVVDDDSRLVGVISFRDLVFRRPGSPLADVMVADPVAVTPDTDRRDVAEICQRYHFFGVPVVDESGLLLGMVTVDAVMEAIQEEASEDFATAVGAGAEETVYTSVDESVRARAPWLLVNLALGIVVALVVEQLTGIISDLPVLAALMPMVATLGGNSGQQSLAVVIRSLATDNIPGSQVRGVLRRQAWIGLISGLLLALVSGGLAMLLLELEVFDPNGYSIWRIGLAVALGVVFNLVVAGLAGTAIPLAMKRMGQDPALASTIFLTLITDTVGFGGFLLIAGLLVR
ncbi:MAG: magnesium transporter [Acidimicrobiales bacterium]|jgi:magnesium transporter|nr:magnesium transporter [Acidimicrobiales bacterium]